MRAAPHAGAPEIAVLITKTLRSERAMKTQPSSPSGARPRAASTAGALFDAAPVGLAVIDPASLRILHLNRRIRSLLGYSRDDIARLRLPDILAQPMPALPAQDEDEDNIPQPVRLRLRRADGGVRAMTGRHRLTQAGGETLLVCAWTSEPPAPPPPVPQAATQAAPQAAPSPALEPAALPATALLGALPLPAAMLDEAGRLLAASPAWQARAASDTPGAAWTARPGADYLAAWQPQAISNPPGAAAMLRDLQDVISGARDSAMRDWPEDVPHGAPRHRLAVTALRHAGKRGAVLTLADSAAEARPEPAGALCGDAAAQRDALLHALPDTVLICSAAGVIDSASPAALRMFGQTPASLAGVPATKLIDPPCHAAFTELLRQALAQAAPATAERILAGRHEDGAGFPLHVIARRVDGAAPQRLAVLLRGLGGLPGTEARLESLQGELAALQLRQAGDMAATLTHELSQPLTSAGSALRAAVQLLGRPAGADAAQDRAELSEAVDLAAEQVQRAGGIVRQLRGVMPRAEAEKQPQDLGQIIRNASALALAGGSGGHIELRLALEPDLPPVAVDRAQMQHLLFDLLRGADGAGQAAQPRQIRIGAQAGQDGVEVCVSDTDGRLPPEMAGHGVTPGSPTGPDGAACGLSLCRDIVEAHGGRVQAMAGPQGGRVLVMTLPVQRQNGENLA